MLTDHYDIHIFDDGSVHINYDGPDTGIIDGRTALVAARDAINAELGGDDTPNNLHTLIDTYVIAHARSIFDDNVTSHDVFTAGAALARATQDREQHR